MGTEFQYPINPFASYRENISFTVTTPDDRDYLKGKNKKGNKEKNVFFINTKDSMDKLLEKDNIESIKRTMLTQENIFKHQVEELHRLYKMQKILMNETRNKITSGNIARNNRHIVEDYISTKIGMENYNNNNKITCNKDGVGYEECDIDLTLGIGNKKKKLETEVSSSSSSSNNKQNNLPHWLYQGLGSSNKTS